LGIRRCVAVLYLLAAFVAASIAVASSGSRSCCAVTTAALNAQAKSVPARPRLVSSKMAHVPLSFEEADGSAGAAFLSRGPGYALVLTRDGAVLTRRAKMQGGAERGDFLPSVAAMKNRRQIASAEVRLSWIGANPDVRAEGVGPRRGTSNYIQGNDPRKWRTDVPQFGAVRFSSLYRGIDLLYHGNQDRVEMDYVVAPNAAPGAIRIGIGGPSVVAIDPQGNLRIGSARDEVLLRAPVAYQEIGGERRIVDARFVLEGSHALGFSIGAYDATQPLIIDPVLDYSASFGGADDTVSDIATDAQGNIYVAGTTCLAGDPATGATPPPPTGSTAARACNDVIVMKFDPQASSLIYSTYIGGSSAGFAARILVDDGGNALLAGTTASSDFPTTGGYQPPAKQGPCSYGPAIGTQTCAYGFVLKLNSAGDQLVFSTLLGGERLDLLLGLAQDAATGNIYVAGATNSRHFPIPGPAAQPAYGGDNGKCESLNGVAAPCLDAFVAEFNPTGTELLASTYLGGDDDDGATAIALDANHNVFVTGSARSATFPVTPGAFQTAHASPAGQRDVFVTELNASLSELVYSTFIGGAGDEFATSIRIDSEGAAYVTGSTTSTDFPIFPAPSGAPQGMYAGPSTADCPGYAESVAHGLRYCGDAFVAKVAPGGASLVFSTYAGGSGNDGALNIALDSSNNAWIVGTTRSADFPLTPDAYSGAAGIENAFVSEISSDGTKNLFSTKLPGQRGVTIEIDGKDNVFVAGENSGNEQPPAATPGTYGNGQGGVFLTKFSPDQAGAPLKTPRADGVTTPDFTVSVQQTSLTITAGLSGTLNVTVTPTGGFNQQVLFGCSGLPSQASCSGPPVTPNGAPVSTTVTIMTKSNALAPGSPRRPAAPIGWIFSPVGIAALTALALLIGFSRRQRMRLVLACGAVLVAVALLSCGSSGNGGGNSTGTPPGTYAVTITGAAGADVHNAPNTVTLKVN
jgi:hypothetical protein